MERAADAAPAVGDSGRHVRRGAVGTGRYDRQCRAADDRPRAGSLVGRFDLGGQCLSAGDRRFAAEFFDAGRCRRLPPHLHRRTRLLHPLVGRLRFCRLAGNADRHAGDSGIRRCGCGEYQYVDHPYHLPARPVGARHGHQCHGGGHRLGGGADARGRDSFDGVVALALRHQYSDRHRGRLAQHAFPAVQSRPALRPSLRLARRRNERPDLRAVDRFGRGFFARARSAHRGLRRVGVLRGGLSLRAQPAPETLSVAAVRSAAHSDLFALGFHVDLLLRRADAGSGGTAVLLTEGAGLQRRTDRTSAHGVASRDRRRCPRGGAAGRARPCGCVGRRGTDGHGCRTVVAGPAARPSDRRGDHLALYVSAALALAGALASSTRISLALPESLRRAKEA